MILVVGSTSKIKELAFRSVFGQLIEDIRTVKSKSLVPDGPFEEETFLGARNRCRTAKEIMPLVGAMYAAIENGLRFRGSDVVDFPVFHCIFPDGSELMSTGPEIVIPNSVYSEWKKSLVTHPNLTWGDVYASSTGCDPKNPHEHLTGIRRVDYLEKTLAPLSYVVLCKGRSTG